MNQINDKVTLLIKTFERPQCLNRLMGSIRLFYPTAPVIIVDDSKDINDIDDDDTRYIHTSFDAGASHCRNLGLSFVRTPYFVTLDDDFVFGENTNLETLVEILENANLDLLGGQVQGVKYNASFKIENNILEFIKFSKGKECGLDLWDIIPQFWMAITDKIKEFGGWDENIFYPDHLPFFLKMYNRIKIGYISDVQINHIQEYPGNYRFHRYKNIDEGFNKILKNYNLKKIIDYHGKTINGV